MISLQRLIFGTLSTTLLAATASAQLTNQDDCANSGVDVVGPGSYFYDTTGATTGAEGQAEPCPPSATIGNDFDIWFTYQATQDAIATVETCGSGGQDDSRLTVYPSTSPCPANMTAIACNDDSCGLLSSLSFQVQAGDTYLVQLGSWPGSGPGTGAVTISESTIANSLELVAHYKLDEAPGSSVAADSSGNGNNGFYLGGLDLGQAGAAPGTGTAVDFNGMYNGQLAMFDGNVEIPASASLDNLLIDLSVTAWVNLNDVPIGMPAATGVNRIFGNEALNGSWSCGVKEDPGLRFTTHSVLDYDITTPVTPGQWTHIAMVFDVLADVTFYVDGVNVGTVAGVSQANTPNIFYRIGAWATVSPCGAFDCAEYMNGLIDDVQVYSGALTDSDVDFLFNNPGETTGSSIGTNFCLSLPTSSGNSAIVTAMGSTSLADQDLDLVATGLPPNVSGIFYYGPNQIAVPFGDGFRCVGGTVQRLPLNSADPFGILIQADVFTAPMPNLPFAVGTFNFQAWFRDPPAMGSGFNLSDGTAVTFTP